MSIFASKKEKTLAKTTFSDIKKSGERGGGGGASVATRRPGFACVLGKFSLHFLTISVFLGYLIKNAKSGYNWKKRYFMLNGNTLTYCTDHRHTESAKGDVLLTEDATIEDFFDADHPYGFTVSTQFVKMKMAAKDAADKTDWTNKVNTSLRSVAWLWWGDL